MHEPKSSATFYKKGAKETTIQNMRKAASINKTSMPIFDIEKGQVAELEEEQLMVEKRRNSTQKGSRGKKKEENYNPTLGR